MRILAALLSLLAFAGAAFAGEEPAPKRAAPPVSSCISCHAQLDGAALEPTRHTHDDIHFLRGLSCHDCHGGNPAGAEGDIDASHDEKKGWRGKPKRTEIPTFCGTCHADAAYMKKFDPHKRVDQLSEYRSSVHGKRNALGDTKTAVCIDCHGVHGIRAVSDARSSVYRTRLADTCGRCHANDELMRSYGLPASQLADYKTSVHARALYEKGDTAAPTCKDCHGSHGAVPPGVESVANVCGSCHVREATLFRETEAKDHVELARCIRCVVCHSNHAVKEPTDDMVGVGPKSACTSCHPPGFPLHEAAREMGELLESVKGRLAEAQGLLLSAERAGVEVSHDQIALQKGNDQLVELRVLAHSFDLGRYRAVAAQALAAAGGGTAAGRRAAGELTFRRAGLGVSLVVIVGVIFGLAAKVRQIEREKRGD